jgi:hypothetical protein
VNVGTTDDNNQAGDDNNGWVSMWFWTS